MSKTSSSLCGPLQPAFYPRAAKRPVLVTNRLRYGLVLIFGAVTTLSLLQPSDVFAQGANASPQGQPFQQLQAESQQGDQELQEQIGELFETSTQADEGLQKQINELSTQLAEATESIDFLREQLRLTIIDLNSANIRIGQLENAVAGLQGDLQAVQNNTVLDLDGLLMLDPTGSLVGTGFSTAIFAGVNVQVVNGDPATPNNNVNGLGNLIVGYNEPRVGPPICSDGDFDNQLLCEFNGEVWAVDHKTGSHNVVGGNFNAYSQYGGVVFGAGNAINQEYATVTAGTGNTASGFAASISGGEDNEAVSSHSSVSGGIGNSAGAIFASGLVMGDWASVSGGWNNDAVGSASSVSGGEENFAGAIASSVSGGLDNEAEAIWSSISGGVGQATGTSSIGCWEGGTLVDTC